MTAPAPGGIVYATDHKVLVDQMTAASSNITSTTLLEVMSVDLPVAGTYYFDVLLIMTSTGTAGRPGFALGGTSTPTAWNYASQVTHYNSATASQGGGASGTSYPSSTGGIALTNSDWTTTTGFSAVHIMGTVTVSAAGTLTFNVNRASGTSTVSVKGSSIAAVHLVG